MFESLKFLTRKDQNKYLLRPWLDEYYSEIFRKAKLRISKERAFTLFQFLKISLTIDGDIAEMGVYKGSTAYLIADFIYNNKLTKNLYLFDTFKGSPAHSKMDNFPRGGTYSDVKIEKVKSLLEKFSNFTIYKQGLIPDTFSGLENIKFSFVHIHLNLYESTLNALRFLSKVCQPGGIILIEDYGLRKCRGVKVAADEFTKDKKSNVFHLPTGQGIIIKNEQQ